MFREIWGCEDCAELTQKKSPTGGNRRGRKANDKAMDKIPNNPLNVKGLSTVEIHQLKALGESIMRLGATPINDHGFGGKHGLIKPEYPYPGSGCAHRGHWMAYDLSLKKYLRELTGLTPAKLDKFASRLTDAGVIYSYVCDWRGMVFIRHKYWGDKGQSTVALSNLALSEAD